MFTIQKQPFGPYELYRLASADGQTALHLAPAAGANVLQIVLNSRPVLDGYETPEALAEAKGGKSAVLFPFPNRLDGGRYSFFGQEYLFPINNAATGNAIHGFVRKEAFAVDRVVLTNHYAAITCSYHYSGKYAHFPFPFQLDLEFSVYTRGLFRMQVQVRNLNHFDMPMGFGWHPYFRLADRTDDHTLTLPPCEQVAVDNRLLPTGVRTAYSAFAGPTPVAGTQLDNCFAYTGKEDQYPLLAEGRLGKLRMNLETAAFPFFQVFTPEERNSIALEPMSCNINAFQNGEGLVQLAPNSTWNGLIELSLG